MELPESHALLNPIHSIASFLNVLSNQSTMELLQERIRYQLEQCDAVSGVVVLEDISRGWCGTSILSDYLREEGVSSLFTVGVEDASVPDASVNGALSSFSSIEHSSIYTACNEDPSVTASCLDSVPSSHVSSLDAGSGTSGAKCPSVSSRRGSCWVSRGRSFT